MRFFTKEQNKVANAIRNIYLLGGTINGRGRRLQKQKNDAKMILLDIANGWKTAIMIVAMIAVFYFFLIKPQSDKAKKDEAYRNSLKAGDELVTAGGIHVRFVSRDGAFAVVEAAPGVKMKVQIATLGPVPERKRK